MGVLSCCHLMTLSFSTLRPLDNRCTHSHIPCTRRARSSEAMTVINSLADVLQVALGGTAHFSLEEVRAAPISEDSGRQQVSAQQCVPCMCLVVKCSQNAHPEDVVW